MTNTELISILDKSTLYKYFCDKYEDMYDFETFSKTYDENISITKDIAGTHITFYDALWELVRKNMIDNGIEPEECECSSFYGSAYVTESWESFNANEADYLTMDHLEDIFC